VLLFIGGLLAEFFMKVGATVELTRGIPKGMPSGNVIPYLMNRTAQYFGEEALYLWSLPILVFRLMSLMPKNVWQPLLRWIPYILLFLVPVIAAPLKKRQIPFLVVGVFSLLQGGGILISSLLSDYRIFVGPAAIPFVIEGVLMILAGVALWTKSKPFVIVTGVLLALFALASPLCTGILSVLRDNVNAFANPNARMPFAIFLRRLAQFPYAYAFSPWPIFKAISLTMAAILAFTAPLSFPKKEKKA
ncbi:MAG: hypothetical protein IKX85_05240, partial [Clostridia bacterium]|nr:hypothetical protein [Clostridia bacterium]